MAFELPALPYAQDALEPHISAETLEYHYGKHHQTDVDKLNGLAEGTDLENKSLEDIVKTSEGGVFNNAAQIWNHTFYSSVSLGFSTGGKSPLASCLRFRSFQLTASQVLFCHFRAPFRIGIVIPKGRDLRAPQNSLAVHGCFRCRPFYNATEI